jgi:hypothetical protein
MWRRSNDGESGMKNQWRNGAAKRKAINITASVSKTCISGVSVAVACQQSAGGGRYRSQPKIWRPENGHYLISQRHLCGSVCDITFSYGSLAMQQLPAESASAYRQPANHQC